MVGTDGCPLRRGGADVFDGVRLIDGWWRDRASSDTNGLALGRCVVESDSLLSWSHRCCRRGFLRTIGFLRKGILIVGTHISTKAPVCGDFSPRAIGLLI